MDSSSDEEDIEKFQEATATEFINDHILKKNKQREGKYLRVFLL